MAVKGETRGNLQERCPANLVIKGAVATKKKKKGRIIEGKRLKMTCSCSRSIAGERGNGKWENVRVEHNKRLVPF